MTEEKPKRANESVWVWQEDKPQWWPGIYEGITEAEALAQVGTSQGIYRWVSFKPKQ